MNKDYQNLSDQLQKIINKYQDNIDISEILDFSDISDQPLKLSAAIAKQSAINAYFHLLHKEAVRRLELLEGKLELFKSRKLKTVTEMLKSDGVKFTTAKLIDNKFYEVFSKNELYIQITQAILGWKKRVDDSLIAINALNVREQSFRSISYMMDSMIKSGLMYPKKQSKKLED